MRIIVVMAGGSGERFWPLSRRLRPKQFLALTDHKPMLVETVERAQGLVAVDRIYVVAGPHLVARIREMLPALPAENLLTEPVAKNTAACLAFAAAVVARRHGEDAVMAVLSADSLIRDRENFLRNAELAFDYAERNHVLVTLGIRPRHPDTGFGYLEIGASLMKDARGAVHRVESFREKPDAATARHYLESGRFLWNSGMFFWKVSVLLREFEKQAAEFARGAREIAEAWGTDRADETVRRVFDAWPSISIDYAVMEKADDVCAVAAVFDWDDVGTWTALARTNPLDASHSVRVGNVVALDTRNCILFNRQAEPSPGPAATPKGEKVAAAQPVLVTLGVENLVVVATDDAILVCHADRVQDIRQVLKTLKDEGRNEYL
jgi:mannose-1-phosphate guanylyltransferase